MSHSIPTEPEQILAQSAWMRRLAVALVRDSAAADDVVQTAWLRAIERGPERSEALPSWLARVVRNASSKTRRSERRREQRERAVARPEALPPVDDVAARIEVQRRVLEALQELDEPFRRTLTMRYLDELSGAEIARRDGVPEGTVRWRISRGLELLRAALDRRHGGDRRAWCVALLPALRGSDVPVSVIGAAAVQGVLVVNVLAKILVAVVGVVAVSAGAWWIHSETSASAPVAAAPAAIARVEAPAALEPATASPASEESERTAITAIDVSRAPIVTRSVPAFAAGTLRARIVDAAQRPLAGARLAIEGSDASAASGGDGIVELQVQGAVRGRSRVASASLASFATRWLKAELEAGKTTMLGDIVLERGATIYGRVLAPSGEPQAGARVIAAAGEIFGPELAGSLRGPSTYPGAPMATTDARGEFRIDGVEAGTRRVWASASGTRFTKSDPLLIAEGAEIRDVELRLVANLETDWIEGGVRDPDGNPVVDASVWMEFRSAEWNEGRAATLDRDANFRETVVLDGPHELRAKDVHGRWPDAVALDVQPGARGLVLQFREPRMLELVVRSKAGPAVEPFTIYAQQASDQTSIGALKQTRLEPGRVQIPMPNEPFLLSIVAQGFAPQNSEVIDPTAAPARIEFVLEPRAGIRGVVKANGAPVAGASVKLFATSEPKHGYQYDNVDVRVRPVPEAEATTDADGRFSVTPSETGDHVVLVVAEGWATAERGPIAIDDRQGEVELEFELDLGGSIEGAVLVSEGKRAEGIIVCANRGDTFARTVRADEHGRYRFDGLTPGAWQVRRGEKMIEDGAHSYSISISLGDDPEFSTDCEVELGETTSFDLDLRDDRASVVEGELVWGGRSTAGWMVALWPASGVLVEKQAPTAVVDENGRFELAADTPGAYRLSFAVPGGSRKLHVPLELGRERKRWFRSIETATLTVRRPANGELTLRAEGDGGTFYATLREAETTFELPAGEVEIGQYVQRAGVELSSWESALHLSLAPGERRTVELDR